VSGIASDGTLDADGQICDPVWSSKALRLWLDTGGNVRESHNPHRPVGKGMSVRTDSNGATWLTSNIVDPAAQRLVRKGVLTAYSVGISRPVIRHDKSVAPNGIIVGGEFAEVSIVDRPSNPRCGITVAKSRSDGSAKFIGKAFTSDDLDAFGTVFKSAKAKDPVSPFDVFPGNKYTEKMFLREMASPSNPDPQSREAARMALGR